MHTIYRQIAGGYKAQNQNLVFLHGILGGWRNFRTISQAFRENHTVLLYDQRGHGLSSYKGPYTVLRLAQDLKELIEDMYWDNTSIVGHSLGGYVALLFATLYPQYVKKIVIVDSSPWPSAEQGAKISNLMKTLPDDFDDRNQARAFFRKAVERGDFSQVMADFLKSTLQKNRWDVLQFQFDKQNLPKLLVDIRKKDWPSLIKKQKSPTLILRGENSTHFLKSDFKKMSELNPLFQLKEIKNSGHWIHADQPKSFIKILQEFLP